MTGWAVKTFTKRMKASLAMKNTTSRLMVVLAALAGLTSSLSTVRTFASSQQGGTYLEWQFDSGANPASPDVASGTVAGIQAGITVGQFGMGWEAQLSSEMASATGVWDLGQSGVITVNLGAAVNSNTITVQVWQWIDPSIYSSYATVAISGATQTAVTTSNVVTGLIGDWMVQQTAWQVTGGAATNAIVITSPASGSLIDKIAVTTTTSAVTAPVVLSIRQLDGASVEISWPVAAGGGTLESSINLADPQAWTAVGTQAQTNGDSYTVTIQAAADNMQFFRLKQ